MKFSKKVRSNWGHRIVSGYHRNLPKTTIWSHHSSEFASTTTTGHRNRAHFGGTRPQKSKGYVLADVWGRFGVSLANKINQNDELCEEDTNKQCFNQDSAMTSWMHLDTDMAYTPLAGMCYNIRVDANNII